MNTSDAEAMKRFNRDVADYNERNRVAAALKTKYETRMAKEAQVKAKLVGTWKFQFDDYGLWRDKWSYTGQVTYLPDGETFFESSAVSDKNEKGSFSWSGHWELEGDHLHARIQSKSKDAAVEIGDTHEYLIQDITETELHYRDLNDGAERVRYRLGK